MQAIRLHAIFKYLHVLESEWCSRYTDWTGWTAEGSEFEYPQGNGFSPLLDVQTGSGAHPFSYQMGSLG
jgi:hypothetical protein